MVSLVQQKPLYNPAARPPPAGSPGRVNFEL